MTQFGVVFFAFGVGAIAPLLAWRSNRIASASGAVSAVAGGVLGLVLAFQALLGRMFAPWNASWQVPLGALRIAVDPLSAFFLVPVFGVSLLTAIYGYAYLGTDARPTSKRVAAPWCAFNVLVGSMVLVLVARQVLLFLVAWELMSLSAYVLVVFEHEKEEAKRAGWVYLVATHLGTSFLFVMFLLLSKHAGSFDFDAFVTMPRVGAGLSAVVFACALVGFGTKAGVVPFHVWLPEAHAAAPSHVSALMSGVMIKLGIYGILRVVVLLREPAFWWGPLLMVLGLTSSVLGIALALGQRDMKRVLAYSSVENMGLITLGIGLGLWGVTSGRPHIASIGVASSLLHIWNHATMKGLMFLSAGSVLHGTGTKDIEKLGGLMKRMPRTAIPMLLGAVAMSGLPPLNGFASEWLLYMGLMDGATSAGRGTGVALFLTVGVLSFVGAMAMFCFLRLIGVALLGEPRSAEADHAHESPRWMTMVLAVLGLLAMSLAVFPAFAVHLARPALAQVVGASVSSKLSTGGLRELGAWNAAVMAALLLVWALLWFLWRNAPVASDSTWGCGYPSPTARMQYTGRSFSHTLSEGLLPRAILPHRLEARPKGVFPIPSALTTESADPVTRGIYEPLFRRVGRSFARLRWLQQGVTHLYLLYIVIAVVLALAWVSLPSWLRS